MTWREVFGFLIPNFVLFDFSEEKKEKVVLLGPPNIEEKFFFENAHFSLSAELNEHVAQN